MDNLISYSGNQAQGYIISNKLKFIFGTFKPTEAGKSFVIETSTEFYSVLYCDCKSDYKQTYPENKPSIDSYSGNQARVYVPKNFPIGNNIYYMIIGITF